MKPISALRMRNPAGSPGGGPTSTQWRLYFPAGRATINQDNTVTGGLELVEVEMRATVGGADQCTGGTPSASSSLSGSFLPANAFDNSNSTVWATATTAGASIGSWLQYTFASAVSVEEILIRTNTSAAAPAAVWVQYYDGSQWQTYFTYNDDATPLGLAATTNYVFSRSGTWAPNDGYTLWRLLFNTGAAGSALEIVNIEMFDKDSSGDRSFAGAASGSSQFGSGFVYAAAFRAADAWAPQSSNIKGNGEWLSYTFYRPESINSIRMTPNAINKGPQAVDVQYWNGSTWVTDWSFTASWPSTTPQTFNK